MAVFHRDGIDFHFRDQGEGLPVLFQHGLGGDVAAPCGLFPPPDGVRRISFDARYHGKTRPLGDPSKLTFDTFAEDLLALLDHLEIDRAVVGGISMGAGIALNFATRFPDRALGLILSRPAWLDTPWPENLAMFPLIGRLIREVGMVEARAAVARSDEYAAIVAQSNDNASTLLGIFDASDTEETYEKYIRIPGDAPCRDRACWQAIEVPTLVLANGKDPLHPMLMAETLAGGIPRSEYREITPKSTSLFGHVGDVRREIGDFLQRHFLTGG